MVPDMACGRHKHPPVIVQKNGKDPPLIRTIRVDGDSTERPVTYDFICNSRNNDRWYRLSFCDPRQTHCQTPNPAILQCQMASGWNIVGILSSENNIRKHLAVRPLKVPRTPLLFCSATVCLQVTHSHALHPMRQRVGHQTLCFAGFQFLDRSEYRRVFLCFFGLVMDLRNNRIYRRLHCFWMKNSFYIKAVENLSGLR